MDNLGIYRYKLCSQEPIFNLYNHSSYPRCNFLGIKYLAAPSEQFFLTKAHRTDKSSRPKASPEIDLRGFLQPLYIVASPGYFKNSQ